MTKTPDRITITWIDGFDGKRKTMQVDDVSDARIIARILISCRATNVSISVWID